MTRSAMALLCIFSLLSACQGEPEPRLELEEDDAQRPTLDGAPSEVDASPVDAALRPDLRVIDSAPPDAALMEDSAAPDAAPDSTPDVSPPPVEEVCNGLDDDQDGEIDEGLSNICGGCGEIPEGGCQSWRINLAQDAEGTLNPDRAVSLLGLVEAARPLEVPGARCELLQIGAAGEDDHLGIIRIQSPLLEFLLVPAFGEDQGLSYVTDTPYDLLQLYEGPERIQISAGGGAILPPFEAEIRGVAPMEEVEGLEGVLEKAVGLLRGETPLSWRAGSASITLYIGGSRPRFSRPDYQSIEHYQLHGRLVDDGRCTLPDLFDGGLPDSSVWVYLQRDRLKPIVFGPHAVLLETGSRAEARFSGDLEGDEPSPVRFTLPDPEAPVVITGAPLRVSWAPLPEGPGPLRLSLTLHDRERAVSRQISCEIEEPDAGALELPAALTEGWPMGAQDVRQISLSWVTHSATLPAPDEGTLTRSITTLLRLPPPVEAP